MTLQPFGQPLLSYYSTIERKINQLKNSFITCKTFAGRRFIQFEYFSSLTNQQVP